jgi:ADP-heptose:LPS heptosyltransferase
VLTFPICEWLRNKFPDAHLIYLGRNYTQSIIESFSMIDEFISWDDFQKSPKLEQIEKFRELKADCILHVFPNKEIAHIAKKVKIAVRIGTSHRSFHLLTCNYRVSFSRKNSTLHESQLNFHLLKPFGLTFIPPLEEFNNNLIQWKIQHVNLPTFVTDFIDNSTNTLILHPKSQGSAKEWPIEKYISLANSLMKNGWKIIVTGTENEGLLFRSRLPETNQLLDTTGKLNLKELMNLISNSKALVACSTGPLHLAGISGIQTIGLFSPRKPIHPGRWKPIGKKVQTIMFDKECPLCKKSKSCSMSSRSKYRTRPGPPYPAQDCKNRKMLGNDRFYYKSKPDKNGIYKWIKIKEA